GQRSFANALSMAGGAVQFGDTEHLASLLFTGTTALAAGQRTFNTVADTTFTGILAGNGASLIKTGDGILTLANANTYDGGTTLAVGTLLAGSDQAFGPGMLNLNGGVIGSASGQRSFANALSMAGGAVQFGDTEHLASLLFTGTTALAAGQRTFNTVADTTFTGILAGNGASLIKTGDGALTLANVNTYDGGTQIQDGAIRIANDSALGRGAITFGGGALASASNATRTISNNVTFNGGATIGDGSSNGAFVFNGSNNVLASGPQTITTNVATTFVNGFTGAGGLTKSGAAPLTLKGLNTYSGNTNIESGKLVLDGSILGSKEIRLAAGAVLGGHGRFDGTISGYGSVDPGNSPGILSASSLTIATGTAPPSGDGQALQNGTGMSFSFEFTQLGAPTWSNAAASGNDVLLLTGSPAFSTALTSANNVNLYFSANLTSSFTTSAWQTVQGGFFTVDTTNSLASAIAGASYSYYFETNDSGSYPTFFYNGQSYVTESAARSLGLLPNGGQSFVVREATVASANFDSNTSIGTVTGLTMEIASVPTRRPSRGAIIAVPEPSTWVMGLMAAGVALARRRRLAGLLARLRRSIPH
ncbi:MAG: autotransporter-associated beta strand repeat-containing protein, partial [Planctomycetota bacterium]|nr:autotransporter-associated beta strand repeat-containing protein [Planctomycetota bacterium]